MSYPTPLSLDQRNRPDFLTAFPSPSCGYPKPLHPLVHSLATKRGSHNPANETRIHRWLTTVVLIGSTIVWTFADQIREPVTKQIEYRTLVLSFPPPPTLLQNKLEEYGRDGWEFVTVIQQSGILIFKR